MRHSISVAAFALFLVSVASVATSADAGMRNAPASTAVPRATSGGGDTFSTAAVIPALPFSDTGTTSGFADDYSSSCGGLGCPDVVYSFTPAANTCVTISLCGSSFDTVLQLYKASLGTVVQACNDDYCQPKQAVLTQVPLEAGETYYIVVDGYGYHGECAEGTYTMVAAVDCPAGVEPGLPLAFAVGPAQPNPAAHTVSFGLDLPAAARVEAAVYDITGRRVAKVASRSYEAGWHTLRWSGLTDAGPPAVSGVYYLRVRAGTDQQTRTLVVAH
jgi:hypothetical protein